MLRSLWVAGSCFRFFSSAAMWLWESERPSFMASSPGGVHLRSALFGVWIGMFQTSGVAPSIDSSIHEQTFAALTVCTWDVVCWVSLALCKRNCNKLQWKSGNGTAKINIPVWQFYFKKLETAIGTSAKARLLHYNGADPDVLDNGGNSVPPLSFIQFNPPTKNC